ncbi:MAG: sulfite exporter TauE/SafE family protein [Pyrinomonadaceae bacterium]|nr:sulfite exporter TauE/SafE family protein [Pyrinomonadaceae bacterium]
MTAYLLKALLLFVSAFAAGAVNSIAGGGTLLTFPALLWAGFDPKLANATSTVALWPGLMGGLWGYRREITESRQLLLPLGAVSVLGGAAGAALLILTPSLTFARLVPFLILFATFLFMAQETITRYLRPTGAATAAPASNSGGAWWWAGILCFQFIASIYGGYFGAGNGILMLAALGLIGISDIHRANGIKIFLAICLNSAAVLGFALTGLVRWPEAILMAVGAICGGYFGASAARRFGRTAVRRAVIAIGLIIGVVMLLRLWL